MSDDEAAGRLLQAIFGAPSQQDGPPYTHTFAAPRPEACGECDDPATCMFGASATEELWACPEHCPIHRPRHRARVLGSGWHHSPWPPPYKPYTVTESPA